MKYLNQMTPAETQLILMGDLAAGSSLLKNTFMDLLLKEVLAINEVELTASSREPVRVARYVVIGKNFSGYAMKNHEQVFLSLFQRNPESSVLFRNLIKMSFENARREDKYRLLILSSQSLSGLFSRSFFQRWTGKFSYTNKGETVKNDIQREISELEATIPVLMKTDPVRGLTLIKSLGGNVFLLTGVEFSALRDFDRDYFSEMDKASNDTSSGAGCWSVFSYHGGYFDDSSSDSDGSGCSGDGGCSGCSGCGGD